MIRINLLYNLIDLIYEKTLFIFYEGYKSRYRKQLNNDIMYHFISKK